MNIPPAEMIEGAVDDLKNIDAKLAWVLVDQRKELHEAVGDQANSDDFASGYNLGLAVARRMIASNVEIILKGVSPGDVL